MGNPVFAKLSDQAQAVLSAYVGIQYASLATVAGEIGNADPYISYFSVRRAERDKILGQDQVRPLLKSSDPLRRAAGAAACNQIFGPKATEVLTPLIRDTHPAVLDAVLDALAEGVTRSETGKIVLDVLPRLPTLQRHKAMRLLGKLKYRQAVGALEEMFQQRDSIDSPVACQTLVAIQGRAFMDGITEYLYTDNPIELHTAILECMAENPAPVYYAKTTQLLKTLRNKQGIAEIVRRVALWSNQGVDLAITLLGSSDSNLADAAQAGLVRHLRATGTLPAGFLQRLAKTTLENEGSAQTSSAQVSLPHPLESLAAQLSNLFSAHPDMEFQQLFFITLTAEKHFLKPRLVHLAEGWGNGASECVERALQLPKEDAVLLRMKLQSRSASQTEQQSMSMTLARMIESIGSADLKAPIKEVIRHLDTPSLPVQMAAVSALASIGGLPEAAEIDRRVSKSHWMLKRKMTRALASLSADTPTAGLFALCEDPEPLVRIAAVRALEGIRHEKAYNVLLKSLRDTDERVRSAACACLKGFPERKEAQAKLFEMLDDTDARVRANTVESLESVLSREPRELMFRLKPFLSDPNARVVINAAKAVFPHEPDLAMPLLDSYLRAPDANLRAGALWALGRLRRPDAFLCLYFHSLREKDPYVRTFVDKAVIFMQDHPFYKDARYLLTGIQTGGTT